MDKQDFQKIVHDVFIKPFKEKDEKQPESESVQVEKTQEKPKKGNMRRGKKREN